MRFLAATALTAIYVASLVPSLAQAQSPTDIARARAAYDKAAQNGMPTSKNIMPNYADNENDP
jgi:hypothetical protein